MENQELLTTIVGKLDDFFEKVTCELVELKQEVRVQLEGISIRIDKLEQRMDKLEQRMDKLEQRIDKLEQRMDNLEQRVTGLEAAMNVLQLRVVSLEENMCALLSNFNMYQYKQENRYNEMKECMDRIHGRMDGFESAQAETNRRLESLEETVKEHNVSISELRVVR